MTGFRKVDLDERVKVYLPPDEFVEAILETGPHPDEPVKTKAGEDE